MAEHIETQDVHNTASKLGVSMVPEEVQDYTALLSQANEIFARLLQQPDYHPPPAASLTQYPRKSVHRPTAEENVLGNAWSQTFSVGGPSAQPPNPPGLLSGKTFCLKDNICVAGVPQHNGTTMVQPWTPSTDAVVVQRILLAGGEIIGTATCENMSYSPSSDTSSAGKIHNPYTENHSAGGSSSGVGALVGDTRGLVWGGIGADQGGSVRIPAAMSGCVGLKATHGLIPYTGIVSSEGVCDHVGPICKSVEDVARVLEVIAGRDELGDDRSVGVHAVGEVKYLDNVEKWYAARVQEWGPLKVLTGMKVGIIAESLTSIHLQAQMRDKLLSAAENLTALGAIVEEVSIPAHATGRDIWFGIRRIGGSLSMLGKVSGRRVYNPLPFLEDLYNMTPEKWQNTPTAVKSTIINGTFANTHWPALYAKCSNLGLGCKPPFPPFYPQD